MTGAGGFIGSHLAERLVGTGARCARWCTTTSRGHLGLAGRVAAQRRTWRSWPATCATATASARAVRDVDVVFHLAALIAIPYSYAAPASYVRTNVEGTLNVLQAAQERRRRARRAHLDQRGLRHGALRPDRRDASAAGPVALLGEQDRRRQAGRGLPPLLRPARGDRAAVQHLRPAAVGRAVIPTIITQCLPAETVRLGNLHPTRDLNYVANTVDGFPRGGRRAERPSGRRSTSAPVARSASATWSSCIAAIVGRPMHVVQEDQRLRPGSERSRAPAGRQRARARAARLGAAVESRRRAAAHHRVDARQPASATGPVSTSFEPGLPARESIPLCVPEIRRQRVEVRQGVPRHQLGVLGRALRRALRAAVAERSVPTHAVATVNGTAALHVALLRRRASSRTTRCWSPTLTFIAPANAIRYVGAWPVFIDAEPDYWQMDPDSVVGLSCEEMRWASGRAVQPGDRPARPRDPAGPHPRPSRRHGPHPGARARVRPGRDRGRDRSAGRAVQGPSRSAIWATSPASASTATRSSPPAAAG